VTGARELAIFGDSITTENHISRPAKYQGRSPAGDT